MDLGTGLVVLGSKDIILKVLGPTADYIGKEIELFTKQKAENLKKIFNNAYKKLGDNPNTTGSVSPRVLKGTINEGSYVEDFLSIEYFGGVLASSRTDIPRDDRGIYFNTIISQLSIYQLRMHYVFYHALKKVFNGENINFGISTERQNLRLFIPYSSFLKAMDFNNIELSQITVYINHIINGLLREQLIDPWFQYGNVEHLQKFFKGVPETGLLLQPNRMGFELFFWAYGLGQEDAKSFLNKDKYFELDNNVIIDSGFQRVK